jgi:hypothetical protein
MASSFTDTLPEAEQWEWLPEELMPKVLGQDGVVSRDAVRGSCSLPQRLVCHLGAQGEVETGEQSRTAPSSVKHVKHTNRLSGYEVDLRAKPLPRSTAPACP